MKKLNKLLCVMVLGLALSAVSCNKQYTVTFDTNDGSEIAAVIVGSKNPVGAITAPTKEGYNFAGWYLDEEFTQEADLTTYVPTADTTVYAKWTIETYDVRFEENGGTTVQDLTVDYGTPVTLPAAPTKEGYDFVKWYLDEELLKPYANQAIKEDTTLYAKWRSGLVYTGTEIGEATYDSEDGSYSFSVSLPLWGRFSLMYYGNLISANDEDLIITGLYNPEPGADWTRNLYVDVPEGGSEIDYTTFICCKPGIYDVTYNPTAKTLDIQDGNPPVVIPETGLCYQYTEGTGADLVAPISVALDSETNTYTFEVSLAQWRYVKLYYNGVVLKAADMQISGDGWVDGTYNASSTVGALYVADGPEQLMRPQGSDLVTYKLTFNPADNSLVIDNLAYEYVAPTIPAEGVYFTYEKNVDQTPTTFYPETSEITVEDGVWSYTVTLGRWKWVAVYEDGNAVAFSDMTISGDGWVDGAYDNSTNGSLYIDSDPTHFLRSQEGDCQYKLSYNPADNTLVIDNLSINEEVNEPTSFEWAVANDQYAVVFTEANQVVDTLSNWRLYIVVDAQGKIAYMVDMPKGGYGNPLSDSYTRHSDYATYTNNPAFANLSEVKENQWGNYVDYTVVVPEGGFALEVYSANATALIEAISGITYAENNVNTSSINVDDIRVSYDADSGKVTVSEAEEEPEVKEDYVWTVANDQYAKVFAEANQTVDTLSNWRFYIVVDAQGKIAYMVDMPISGYGNPLSDSYARHSDYATYTNNPAFANLSEVKENQWGNYVDYTVVVPEGGFVIEVHSATSIAFVEAVTGTTYAEHAINTTSFNVDNIRLSYDATTGTVTVSEAEEEVIEPTSTEWAVANDQYAKVFTEANQTVDTLSNWRFYVVVDAQGKIAYMVDMPIGGYGNPLSDSYTRHSDYATYTNNPAFANLSEVKENQWGNYVDYTVVVPEGGFALEVFSANATALIEAISGITYAENNVNTSSINVDNIRISYDAATGIVTVLEI